MAFLYVEFSYGFISLDCFKLQPIYDEPFPQNQSYTYTHFNLTNGQRDWVTQDKGRVYWSTHACYNTNSAINHGVFVISVHKWASKRAFSLQLK